jgi:hypothetical protein
LCQVTSNPYADTRAVAISDESLEQGALRRTSYARPGRLFTANHELMVRQVGVLKAEMHKQIINAVVDLLRDAVRA